ncbi:alpha/beta fold hydrolase [Pigmentiphaga aceris]|uniref:alpha/beta fold hydrolase n=1 Tax=Pigmentiphaga aceris TaxID=1940612 RepID=UPI001651E98F|nr:alpha/beta hydrolase [Pigmentiphaga aceris]
MPPVSLISASSAIAPRQHRIDGIELEIVQIPATRDGLPTLVFLHEALGSIPQWRDFPANVCARSGCAGLVFSRYGLGQSTPLTSTPRPTDYLENEGWNSLPALLRDLDIRRPYLIGHSDGASIALLYAARNPVIGLTAMAPHVRVEEVTLEGVRTAEADRERLVTALGKYHRDAARTFDGWSQTWASAEFRDWNIQAAMSGIAAPTLLIQGENDQYGTMEQLDWITDGIASGAAKPPVRRVELANVGHVPWREAADTVLDEIAAHIRMCTALPG